MKYEIVGDDIMLNIDNDMETLISEDRTIEDIEKDFPGEIGKMVEALNLYLSESDLKNLKTEFDEKWKYLSEV